MKYDNQLRYASNIIEQYDGKIPLSSWLKDFFRINKQMGSRDRKTVSEMVYGYYRSGFNQFSSVEERILAYIKHSDTLPEVKDHFFGDKNISVEQLSIDRIFPFKQFLSDGIDAHAFSGSFLIQPDLFLRIRPAHKQKVLEKLSHNKVHFNICDDDCVALPNSTRTDFLDINKEAVVQDRSSQETGKYMREAAQQIPDQPSVWDCFAASGGKSIMAYDIIKNIKLTVSDIREPIIVNLKKRFSEAGISNYSSFVADLTYAGVTDTGMFDLVIADVPCSGSGTWSRTPEQLYFFKDERIQYYSELQKRLIANVVPSLKQNGMLLYITCSVFSEENEKMAEYISRELHLDLLRSELIKGYDRRADTLYAALFINRSA